MVLHTTYLKPNPLRVRVLHNSATFLATCNDKYIRVITYMLLQVELQCMSGSSYDKTIQFRAGAEKEAAELLDEIHIGGVNVSELARVGLVEMLRQSLDEQDKIAVYERYSRGEIGEDVARVLLGEKLDRMEEEKASFEAAMERDTSEFLTGSDGE